MLCFRGTDGKRRHVLLTERGQSRASHGGVGIEDPADPESRHHGRTDSGRRDAGRGEHRQNADQQPGNGHRCPEHCGIEEHANRTGVETEHHKSEPRQHLPIAQAEAGHGKRHRDQRSEPDPRPVAAERPCHARLPGPARCGGDSEKPQPDCSRFPDHTAGSVARL